MQAQRIAVLAPGGGYGVDAPLLFYARLAVVRRDAEARPITWRLPESFANRQHQIDVVRAQAAEVLDALPENVSPLIIAKSLGSLAAGLVAERALPAIWLTPLLTVPQVVTAIQSAARPPLLIGGTADDLWDPATARRLSPHVLEIPDADHALHVPGPVSATTAVAGQVLDAVESFIDAYVWQG